MSMEAPQGSQPGYSARKMFANPYPQRTSGTAIAAQVRSEANQMSAEERSSMADLAKKMIPGRSSKEIAQGLINNLMEDFKRFPDRLVPLGPIENLQMAIEAELSKALERQP